MVEQPDYEERETLEFERGNFLTKIGPALHPGRARIVSTTSRECSSQSPDPGEMVLSARSSR